MANEDHGHDRRVKMCAGEERCRDKSVGEEGWGWSLLNCGVR